MIRLAEAINSFLTNALPFAPDCFAFYLAISDAGTRSPTKQSAREWDLLLAGIEQQSGITLPEGTGAQLQRQSILSRGRSTSLTAATASAVGLLAFLGPRAAGSFVAISVIGWLALLIANIRSWQSADIHTVYRTAKMQRLYAMAYIAIALIIKGVFLVYG